MKRLLTFAAMFLCCIATSFAQFSGSGSGTESDPYLILNPIHLNQMRNFLNQEGVYFKIMADIDLTEFIEEENPSQGWQPVGSLSAPFSGILDGNYHEIKGLWTNRPSSDYVGLFGYTSNATIKNITLSYVNITGNNYVGGVCGNGSNLINTNVSGTVKGNTFVGGFCGSGGSFENCKSKVDVFATGHHAGGLTGSGGGNVLNCYVECKAIQGKDYVGGLCGEHSVKSRIEYSCVSAKIEGNDYIGGIIGYTAYYEKKWHGTSPKGYPMYWYFFATTINNNSFIGNIVGNSYVGGIVGAYSTGGGNSNSFSDHNISNCFSYCEIKANDNYVGGIAGYVGTMTNILNCYSMGSIVGNENVGGIVGKSDFYSNDRIYVQNSYAKSTIAGGNNVGGIVGYNKGAFVRSCASNCYSIASVGEYSGRIYGLNLYGIYGSMGSSEENKSYNRTNIIKDGIVQEISDDEQNGTGVSSTTLKLKATYVAMGWDFTETWEIQETECYPYFKTQTAPPVITSNLVSGATTISGKCVDGGTITLEVDRTKQQMVSSGHNFSFNVSPLQAGHEVRLSAKADGKEQSYYTTEVVSFIGKGTEADPYQVYTAADLTGVYRKGYFKLMNDIDLTSYINQYSPTEGWQSIGREGSETVYFDGNGHKITGLWCNSTRDNTGLFSCFANGYIKNLTVEVAKNKQIKGGANTGIIIGKMIKGTIENCRVSGNVADGTPVGGIVGLMDDGKISLSQASVTINTTGEKSYVGGLVGEITGGEIDQCITLGTLTATGQESYVGGLVGNNYATVTNCYSNANVTSSYNAAGLIAYNYGVVDKCYATGNLFSSNYGAGVIGYNDGENAVVKNCVAMNYKIDVTYESQSAQSGGYGQRIIGGIKNGAPAPEMNNYALKTMQVSVNDLPQKVYDDLMNGVAKTGTKLVKQTTYQELGWSFTDVWSIAEGESYPSLKKNAATVIGPPVTITAKNYTIEYGDDLPTFEYTCDGTISGTPSITCEATKTSPVGTYPIVISKGSVTNNNVTYVNGTLTIKKAPLKITAKDYTIKQGDALPTFEATYEGFKNSETSTVLTKKPTITTTATSASEPGEYDITVSGAEATNYAISYIKGKLTITEADPVTVTAKSYTIEYGDDLPSFEYTSEGAPLTGTPSITCEATKTSPVGTYTIVIKKGTVKNYNDTYVNGTLTIKKAPLTITAKDYTIKQGQTLPEFEATFEGFKNNETSAVLTKQPVTETIATSESEPGEYDITVSGAEAQNYEITYVNGKLTIEKPAYIPGDANGDGLVNVTDIVATVNYIMEKPSDNFNKAAADLSGDGDINVTDIVKMVSIIMNGNGGSSRRASATSSKLVISRNNIQLRNAEAYTAAQFDINLSNGQSISNVVLNVSSDHDLYWKMVDANTYRVVVYSMTNAAFRANSDNLFTVFMTGSQNATISNELLIKADGTTGIDAIRTEVENGNVYDMNGRQVKNPRKGVYIINGRKVVVK